MNASQIVIGNPIVSAAAVEMLSIATMFVLVWILQIQNALMVALAVIMTSEFGGLMLGRLRPYTWPPTENCLKACPQNPDRHLL